MSGCQILGVTKVKHVAVIVISKVHGSTMSIYVRTKVSSSPATAIKWIYLQTFWAGTDVWWYIRQHCILELDVHAKIIMSCSRSKIAPISIKAQRQQISKRRQHVEKMIGVRNANRNMKFKRIPAAHKVRNNIHQRTNFQQQSGGVLENYIGVYEELRRHKLVYPVCFTYKSWRS